MEPNWKPLGEKLGTERCAGFMFLDRVNGINRNHGIARIYLNLDDSGQCCASREHWKFEKAEFACELTKLEAALAELGETLESVYDEAYIAQKKDAWPKVSIPL
jgi:hypothetical protein